MDKTTNDIGLEKRKEVLATSLIIEGLTSAFLASLLGIKNHSKTKPFGNTTSALSFSHKIDLLTEIGALAKENRSKFQVFMEIRNQFIHNLSATTYEKCFLEMKGKDTFILKAYPQQKSISRERQLELATRALSKDILEQTVALTKKLEDKIKKEVEAELAKKTHDAFLKAIKEIQTTLDEYFEREIEKKPTINTKLLKGFGTRLSKQFLKLSIKNLDLLTKND